MKVFSVGLTAIVLDHVVAVECDAPFSGEEAVRVYLSGQVHPLELCVEDPEKTYLEICAALQQLCLSKRQR